MKPERHARSYCHVAWMVCLATLTTSGCLCHLRPSPKPPQCLIEQCHEIAHGGRRHVYVFLINGLDPVDCANLIGVRQYLIELGFTKTYYAQCFHVPWLADEICKIHREDPHARVALVGHGIGANLTRQLTDRLNQQDIDVDLQIRLGGFAGACASRSASVNDGRVIQVATWPRLNWKSNQTECLDLSTVPWCQAPTHSQVLEVLTRELIELAESIPLPPSADQPTPRTQEMGPTPHPMTSGAEAQSAPDPESPNVLRPVQRLRMPRVGHGPGPDSAAQPDHDAIRSDSE